MQCPQCQHQNREGAKFCNECGAKLEAACPQCGHPNPPGSRFCDECGARLGQPSPAPTAASAGQRAPDTYTPKHLAERIISSRAAVEGERKHVTVLFADLKGSMELLADRDPEEARAILDPVLERMMQAVHRYEGTVNQVMGDGIMALFGAPLAHEDHAVRACYAALRMQESVKQYADEVWRDTGVRVQIRVGLNSGEVVVRSIGSDLRMDYTAVGQTTHLAARMEQSATPGAVLIPPDTLRLVEGYVQIKALGPIVVKGLDEPVEVYEVVGVGASRTRLQAAAARGLTRFVGRDAELEVLRHTLERAGAGHGQVAALVGEPGVGKSRLLWEFTHSHRTQGWQVLESGSVSYGKATSYLPVSDLLRTYLHVEAADDPRRIRQKVLGKVLDLDRTLEPCLPALLSLLDAPTADPAWDALDPPERRQRTLEAVKRLLFRESQEQPLLLVFEDLHWIDTETQALLDSLVDSLPTARLLLLVNYRPEYEHSWGRKTYYQQLRLDPLPPESAEALLGALLGEDASLAALKELLIQRTEGNPFFLEESVRTLVETGALAGERGAHGLATPITSTQVPATVQAILAARMDRLTPEDKQLLQAAAVIGKDVPYPLLVAITESPESALRQSLARLQEAEFLYETSLFPDLEYTFKHALTHEVAYSSLLQERRRTSHARIVDAMEALHVDRPSEQVEQLAYHALRGEAWEKAGRYAGQAGARAASRSAYEEAVAHLQQALAALEHVPQTQAAREQAIDLRHELRYALTAIGRRREGLRLLLETEILARDLGDERRLATTLSMLANQYWGAAEQDRAIDAGERALAIGSALGDVALQVTANFHIGRAYHALGQYEIAASRLQRSIQASAGELLHGYLDLGLLPSVAARTWLAYCHINRGEVQQALAVAQESVAIAETEGQAWSLICAWTALGSAYIAQGRVAEALGPLERALATCDTARIPLLVPMLSPPMGMAYALSGRVAEAIQVSERGVQQTRAAGNVFVEVECLCALGEAHLLAGHPEDAASITAHGLALAQSRQQRGDEAWVLRLLGDIAAHPDPPDAQQAESYYRQALALAEELGMPLLVAHCHLGLGTLYGKLDRDEEAQAELETAAEMYRAMEMPFWLTKAETALAGTGAG
jgi:predicted ATPase/class 3 adenylate cyclase